MSRIIPNLPRYLCHKVVGAARISDVVVHAHPDRQYDDAAFEASPAFKGGYLFLDIHGRQVAIGFTADWYRKHRPVKGGYFVQYEDGYESFSPADAFEKGYRLMPSEPVEPAAGSGAALGLASATGTLPQSLSATNRKMSLGRIVLYVLSEDDADQINRRRTSSISITDRFHAGKWPHGAQAHIGPYVTPGEIVPAIAVEILSYDVEKPAVSLQVFLNGNDQFWVMYRRENPAKQPGTWHWPESE